MRFWETLETRLLLTVQVTYHPSIYSPVLTNVQTQHIYLGSQWQTNAALNQSAVSLDAKLNSLVSGPYMDLLSEYYQDVPLVGREYVARGTHLGSKIANYSLGANITDAQIRGYIESEIQNSRVPYPNTWRTLYVVFLPPGVASQECVEHGWGAYHSANQVAAGQNQGTTTYRAYAYAVIPHATYSVGSDLAEKEHTIMYSHELTEAVTNPGNGLEPFTRLGPSWYADGTQFSDRRGQEIADLAAGENAKYGLFNGVWVQAIWSNNPALADHRVLPPGTTQVYAIGNGQGVFTRPKGGVGFPEPIDPLRSIIPRVDYPRALEYQLVSGAELRIGSTDGLLSDGLDPQGFLLSFSISEQPIHGTLTTAADGSFVYAPNAGFVGEDSFTYRLSNGYFESLPYRKTLHINTPLQVYNAGLSIDAIPGPVVAGADGNLWFVERRPYQSDLEGTITVGGGVGRASPSGNIDEFVTRVLDPRALTRGPDGNIWIVGGNPPFYVAGQVARIASDGTETIWTLPAQPSDIAAGPDGSLWLITRRGRIYRFTIQGSLTQMADLSYSVDYDPQITPGPDGNLWFTDPANSKVGRITPAGVVTEFNVGGLAWGITSGPDGNIWFTETSRRVGRITSSGTVTEFPITNASGNGTPFEIISGPDGNLWFTLGSEIGRMTTSGTATYLSLTTPELTLGGAGIAFGEDGNLWVTYSSSMNASNDPQGGGIARMIVPGLNQPPTISALSDQTIEEGNPLTFTLKATDSSTPESRLSYIAVQLPAGAVFDPASRRFSWMPTESNGPDLYQAIFIVSDGTLSSTKSVIISVLEANRPPALVAVNDITIPAGAPYSFQLLASDDDLPRNALIYAARGLPQGAVFWPRTGEFEWTPSSNQSRQSFSIEFEVNDGEATAAQTITFNVTDANVAPILDNLGSPYYIAGVGKRLPTSLTIGILITDLLATGAGGNPITDPDAGALKGIAITAIDKTFGKWQYSTVASPASDSDWTDVDAGSAVSDSSALLLKADATTRIRMISALTPHHEGTPAQGFIPLESKLTSGITFRAWDQTFGTAGQRGNTSTNGGTTAFSTASETLNVFFEARLWRSFNTNASLNVYTLEAEFNALTASPAYQDRATGAYTGFTIFLSPLLATLPTASLYRMYYGVQFNDDGTETDMGYRYLTTSEGEAQFLENAGPASKRPQRAGTYFREQGVNNGTGIIGYIYSTSQPGTAEMSQIYRTDLADKPTRPGGTAEGSAANSVRSQELGDHVYTTNKSFEKTKAPGTLHVDGVSRGWREEAARGFVRELTPNPSLQLPVNAPLLADESGSVAPTTSITVSPRLATILLPETLLTGLYATTATSVAAPMSVGLIAVPLDAGPSASEVEVQASTANDSAESTPGEINDTVYELVPEADSIDQFWQSIATSLEPVVLA